MIWIIIVLLHKLINLPFPINITSLTDSKLWGFHCFSVTEIILGKMHLPILISILCSQSPIRKYILLQMTQYKNAHFLWNFMCLVCQVLVEDDKSVLMFSQGVSILAYAKNRIQSVQSTWPHPGLESVGVGFLCLGSIVPLSWVKTIF